MPKFRTSRSEPLFKPFHFYKDSKVQPQFAFDCDINNIVSGMAQPIGVRPVDTTEKLRVFSPDLFEKSMLQSAEAKNLFMQLPSDVRKRFDNKPAKLLEFISNPDNLEEGIKLGLFTRHDVSASDKIVNAIKDLKTAPAVTSETSSKGSTVSSEPSA